MSKLLVLFILNVLIDRAYCNKLLSDKGTIDMRFTCVNNSTRSIYLPLGVGKMEAVSLFISSKFVKPQCKLRFYTYPAHNIGIILVIELLEGSLVAEDLVVVRILHFNYKLTSLKLCKM
nr:unnamed protein product [Callosobruchus chinensis]